MQPPAVQAALDNLVETVRTSLMAEFLELLREGKPAKIKGKRTARPAKKSASKARRRRTTKTAG
jgi:hypothetical protein